MQNGTKGTVTFECRTATEADRIRYAVELYRHVLKQRGQDPRNYAPADSEGAGFGWDAVERAARDMHAGSKTIMSRRMAGAIMDALSTLADRTPDYDKRKAANWTAARLELLISDGADPETRPCEGCGAEAGEPCNPYMGCQEQAAEALGGGE